MASEIVRTSVEEGKRKDKSPGAYVTFLAGDGDYVKGAVGLAKGLKKVDSAYPLVVAALPDVPESHRRILVSQGCIIRDIEPVYPPENQTEFAKAYYAINYSKLRIWEVIQLFILLSSLQFDSKSILSAIGMRIEGVRSFASS